MIDENVKKILEKMSGVERALDVGGWNTQLNVATHVIDHLPYETRLPRSHDPWNAPRFTSKTWLELDVTRREPWPFPDKYFEFSACSHVLEDVRDPVWVISELSRVSKAGYIETPKPALELLAGQKFLRPGSIGGAHHRWFVEFDGTQSIVRCRMKPYDLLTKGIAIRYWTVLYDHRWKTFNQGMFWEGSVAGEEVPYSESTSYDYARTLVREARAFLRFDPIGRVVDKGRRTTLGVLARS